jgi:hypothetical protein
MPGHTPRRVREAAYDDPIRVAWRRKHTLKKHRERCREKAKRMGLSAVPPWMWNRHEVGCACYDCLWGDPPWVTQQDVAQRSPPNFIVAQR